MNQTNCDLKSCLMCRFCLKDWLPAIAVNRKNFEIKKGHLLFAEGDAVKGIYFIFSGVVKVHKRWGAEKDLILRFAKAGDIVGQMGLGTDAVYPVSATAIEKAIVCFVDVPFFESTLNVNHNLVRKLMTTLADQLQESEKRMRNMVHMPVKGRVAQALITLKNQFGITKDEYINIEISRQDLASLTGAVYESLFRVMNDLIKGRLIEIAGKSILITNETELIKLTEEICL